MLEHTKALVKSGAFLFSVSFNVLTVLKILLRQIYRQEVKKRKDILIVLTGPV
jgi:hypothetical protein